MVRVCIYLCSSPHLLQENFDQCHFCEKHFARTSVDLINKLKLIRLHCLFTLTLKMIVRMQSTLTSVQTSPTVSTCVLSLWKAKCTLLVAMNLLLQASSTDSLESATTKKALFSWIICHSKCETDSVWLIRKTMHFSAHHTGKLENSFYREIWIDQQHNLQTL